MYSYLVVTLCGSRSKQPTCREPSVRTVVEAALGSAKKNSVQLVVTRRLPAQLRITQFVKKQGAQAMLQMPKFVMAIWSSGIALNLDTTKQEAKLVYDHLISSREMSELSFLVPPGDLGRAEAIIEPTMKMLQPEDVEEAQDAGQQGSPSGVLSDHAAASLPEGLMAQLRSSCEHVDPAIAAARVEIRKNIWLRFKQMDESILDAAEKVQISEQRLQQLFTAQLPLAFRDTAQYDRFKKELHAQVQAVLLKETSERANTIRSILVIVNGTSATFYSEKDPGLTKTFDNRSLGSSDLDVALVFETEPYITL